ncbi:ROK family protein [Granulicella sibirica]|uniref:ROK family protein n=1 Tax=Granulicella sibirica TaxID=2479048 RepID=UPI001F4F4D4E|nr:ROK family protein [Granulicella sibirica]
MRRSADGIDKGYVVGVDLGGTNLRLALADGHGEVLARWSTRTVGIKAPDEIVKLISAGVDGLAAQTGLGRHDLLAVGVGAPGVTNAETGVVIATSYLMGWRDVPLRALLESALGLPVSVDNDVNVAALGESRTGLARDIRDFVFLAIGSGVGAGIVLNGRIFQGAGWTAGEIGYMLLPGLPEEAIERGRPGALEGFVGGEGIRARWKSLWDETKTTLPMDITATEIFDHASAGETLADAVLYDSARTLAYAIYNMALILNCPLFVLGGGVGMHPALCARTRKILEARGTRAVPKLVISALGEEAQLIGAIRLAMDTAIAHGAVRL